MPHNPETSLRLGEEDGRAVDLLLDGQAGPGANGSSEGGQAVEVLGEVRLPAPLAGDGVGPLAAMQQQHVLERRLTAAQRWLGLLGQCPAAEPSQELVARVLQRVEQLPPPPRGG